jgi:hypothetical protein
MSTKEIKKTWLKNYKTSPQQLEKMTKVNGLISAFNSNIDAVIKLSGKTIEKLINNHNLNQASLLVEKSNSINSKEDVFRGLLNCFTNGIAEEWLIEDKELFFWIQKNLGYDKLQMGGQGGIVANVMAVCGVNNVFVHCASLAEEQAKLFLDLPNLVSVNEEGKLDKMALDKAASTPKVLGVYTGRIENGMDIMRIGGKILGLFIKEKEAAKKEGILIDFTSLAKSSCDKKFYLETLHLKREQIDLFLQFCDADPKSKLISENANILSVMDFLSTKNIEFKKLKN